MRINCFTIYSGNGPWVNQLIPSPSLPKRREIESFIGEFPLFSEERG